MERARLLTVAAAVCLVSCAVQAEPLGCLIQPYQEADVGTQAWALLILAAPSRSQPVTPSAVEGFHDKDGRPLTRPFSVFPIG